MMGESECGEVYGVRLEGFEPFGWTEVALVDGLYVIAGLNGVGKTRLLKAVESALNGTLVDDWSWEVMFAVPDDARDVLSRLLIHKLGVKEPADLQGAVSRAVLEVTDCPEWFPFTAQEVADAVAAQGLFILTADRDLELVLWAAIGLRSEDPVLRAVTKEWSEQWACDADPIHSSEEYNEGPGPFVAPLFDTVYMIDDWDQPSPFETYGLPVRAVPLGRISRHDWPFQARSLDAEIDIDRLTCERIARTFRTDEQVLEVLTQESTCDDLGVTTLPRSPHAWARMLSERADEVMQRLFPGGPSLECRVRQVPQWLTQSPVQWVAKLPGGPGVAVTELGQAHRRWATWSIAAALGAMHGQVAWLLMDEPEVAVHRAAERGLADAFRQVLREQRLRGIATTHSPEIMRVADYLDVVVHDRGSSYLRHFDGEAMTLTQEAGLNPSDLLGWYETFVLVEGLHDQVVVEGLIGDGLAQARAKVVRMSGVREAAGVVDSQLFAQFSDANMVVFIDGLQAHVREDWEEIAALAQGGDDAKALRILEERFPADRGYEARFIQDAGRYLIRHRCAARMRVVSAGVADVVELLPISAFTTQVTSWAEARKRIGLPKSGAEFKKRFKETFGTPISARSIERAVESMQSIPNCLTELLALAQDALA